MNRNKNATIGLMLVIMAAVLAGLVAASDGSVASGLFGKAMWYLPYVALVGGIRKLLCTR